MRQYQFNYLNISFWRIKRIKDSLYLICCYCSMTKNNLEARTGNQGIPVLVVEDEPANIGAARKYFQSRSDLKPDFARTKEETLKLMESDKVYAFAIIDVNFPDHAGEEPSRNGPTLSDLLFKKQTPKVYLTVKQHGTKTPAKIYLTDEDLEYGDSYSPPNIYSNPDPEWKDCYASKNDSNVWERVVKLMWPESMMLYRARLRRGK